MKWPLDNLSKKDKKDVDNNVDNIVSTDVELNEDVMEDFYKYHEKMLYNQKPFRLLER